MVTRTLTNRIINLLSVLISITLFVYSSQTFAVNITVKASHNPVSLDDSFHLVYEADSNVDGHPDFSPLEKNFDILNSSQSTNMRLINGHYSLKKAWDLVLIARNIGHFTIPSISFGKDKSPSIRLTIKNSVTSSSTLPNGQASIPAKIFLESSVNKKTAWIQAQIIYSVRLLRTVGITGASLSQPTTSDPDAIIQKLGADTTYQTRRKGIQYEVIERRYVIYPQHSGKLTIKPVTFEGQIDSMQPRSIFDQFQMSGRLKRLRSPSVTVQVKPEPAKTNTQDWLPAGKLKLTENWSSDINHVKTGEPITRTISIVAQGQTGTSLPNLNFSRILHLQQYPDKATTSNQQNTVGIIGTKQIKVALIPAKPGNYVLPEIKLPWWNTHTNKAEVAILPAITLHVTGAITQIAPPVTPPGNTQPTSRKVSTMPASTGYIPGDSRVWQGISLTLALGWIITLIYLFTTRSHEHSDSNNIKPKVAALPPLGKAVLQACNRNHPEAIKNALLAWAQIRWPDQTITSLSQLAQQCPMQLRQEIEQLNKALYNSTTRQAGLSEMHINALVTTFKQYKKEKRETRQTGEVVLEPLYKS